MLKRISGSIHPVRDMAAAKAWYVQVLGRDPSFDQPFYIGFDFDGTELGLVPTDATTAPGPMGSRPYWQVDNVEAALAHWQAHGAKLHEPVAASENMRFASVRDPDDNIIGLIEIHGA